MGKYFSREAVYHVEIADGRTVDIAVDLERGNVRVEGAPHVGAVVSMSKVVDPFVVEHSDLGKVTGRGDRFVVAVDVSPGKVETHLHRFHGSWWFEHQAPRLTARISSSEVQVWASVHDAKGNEQVVRGTRPFVEESAGASKPS